VTRSRKDQKFPRRVGVPERTPEGLRVSPFGRLPDVRAHVYGGTPPVALNVNDYGTPTVPAGSVEGVVIARVATVTVSESACVSD
jgi:hypothetical protein